jgi:hypothetical protein
MCRLALLRKHGRVVVAGGMGASRAGLSTKTCFCWCVVLSFILVGWFGVISGVAQKSFCCRCNVNE